jgi:poly-gamma-glutamate synthesis protein (capsule biosynthesis protein)
VKAVAVGPSTRHRRLLFWLAVAAALSSGTAGALSARSRAPAVLRVDSHLPSWLAPGARVTVAGFAGADEPLVLRAGGSVLARTTSGPLGGFRFRFRAPEPGRYQLTVAAADRTAPGGSLVVRPLLLDAVGDITFGEQAGQAVLRYGGSYPWAAVAGPLRRADITAGNLETSISRGGEAASKRYAFRGPPQAIPPMRSVAGFDVLTLANNHSVDYGRGALLDTLRFVRAAGIQPVGAGANTAQAHRPALVSAGGIRVAFLGYSDVNPLGSPAGSATPGTARAESSAIAADVRAASRRADVVVCFFHWGTELRAEPESRQQAFAAACLAAGAEVVLGAHPHVFGPVVRPGTRTLVAWTLGNFVFPSSGVTARTGILEVRLDARGVRGYRVQHALIDGFRPHLVP